MNPIQTTFAIGALLLIVGCSATNDRSQPKDSLSKAQTIQLPDGNTYQGDISGNLPHGYGKISYQNGNSYIGEFKNGSPSGNGELITADGRYQGEIVEGTPHGFGVSQNSDGSTYEGEHRNGQFHGRGKLTLSDGSYFLGTMRNNRVNRGHMHFTDGTRRAIP